MGDIVKSTKSGSSNALKGKTLSEETKLKISKKMKGRVITSEWKEKIRQGNLGKHGKKTDRVDGRGI